MDFYKISKNEWQYINQFQSIEDAQNYAESLGQGYTASFWRSFVAPTLNDRLEMDINFCSGLIAEFLEDNRKANITTEQSDAILLKFKNILSFAQTGAIASIEVHLPLIPIDDIFTQTRKDKYINQITEYVQKFQ